MISKTGSIFIAGLLISVTAIGLLLLLANRPELTGQGRPGTEWGMSTDQVKALYPGIVADRKNPIRSYSQLYNMAYTWRSLSMQVSFEFDDAMVLPFNQGRLSSITLTHEQGGNCDTIKALLTKEYGSPTTRFENSMTRIYSWEKEPNYLIYYDFVPKSAEKSLCTFIFFAPKSSAVMKAVVNGITNQR